MEKVNDSDGLLVEVWRKNAILIFLRFLYLLGIYLVLSQQHDLESLFKYDLRLLGMSRKLVRVQTESMVLPQILHTENH